MNIIKAIYKCNVMKNIPKFLLQILVSVTVYLILNKLFFERSENL